MPSGNPRRARKGVLFCLQIYFVDVSLDLKLNFFSRPKNGPKCREAYLLTA